MSRNSPKKKSRTTQDLGWGGLSETSAYTSLNVKEGLLTLSAQIEKRDETLALIIEIIIF